MRDATNLFMLRDSSVETLGRIYDSAVGFREYTKVTLVIRRISNESRLAVVENDGHHYFFNGRLS